MSFFYKYRSVTSRKIPSSNNTYEYLMTRDPCSSFATIPTSPSEILKIGQMMRITNSTGCDDLDPVILSSHLDQLAITLTEIFNCSFATGIVPQSLKMAKVTPNFKQGSRSLASNYRPISVLSYFAKIMEKIMYDRL